MTIAHFESAFPRSQAFVCMLLLLLAGRAGAQTEGPAAGNEATFVGRDVCARCHPQETQSWAGSDHDRAMDVATPSTVLGDFEDRSFEHLGARYRFLREDESYRVRVQQGDERPVEYVVSHVFGFDPLQQYLVPFPGGRLQVLPVAWDVAGRRWFHVRANERTDPGEWLHWTRAGQNWNGMCAECHSTNLRKNYDAGSDRYDTTWSEIDVSCEACHGPGAQHVDWAELPATSRAEHSAAGLVVDTGGADAKARVELCAPCHSRRVELGDYDHRGGPLLQRLKPVLLDEGSYHPDGQILEEVYVYGSFVQSGMHAEQVSCRDCHDVHNLRLRFEGNALCTRCHEADRYDVSAHHFHTTGARCVDCHMPESVYMGIDRRADHSIRSPRPDLSVELGVPNACTQAGCHADRGDRWAAERFRELHGERQRPHFGRVLAAGRADATASAKALAKLAIDESAPVIVRATALSLLRSQDGMLVGSAFAVGLHSEHDLLRYTAVEFLPLMQVESFVAALLPLLEDPLPTIRGQAAWRLSTVPDDAIDPEWTARLEAASAEYERAMEHSLDFAFGAHNLGNLVFNRGDAARARELFQRALAIDPDFAPSRVNLERLR